VQFIVSKPGLLASEDEAPTGVATEIPQGATLVILYKQYDPARVRFRWSRKTWWAFKNLLLECAKPETDRDHL
jgi:hypothetical protein